MNKSYQSPSIKVLGSLSELTLVRNKDFGTPNDGDFFHHKGLTTVS